MTYNYVTYQGHCFSLPSYREEMHRTIYLAITREGIEMLYINYFKLLFRILLNRCDLSSLVAGSRGNKRSGGPLEQDLLSAY